MFYISLKQKLAPVLPRPQRDEALAAA
jgi:hypothetical protein